MHTLYCTVNEFTPTGCKIIPLKRTWVKCAHVCKLWFLSEHVSSMWLSCIFPVWLPSSDKKHSSIWIKHANLQTTHPGHFLHICTSIRVQMNHLWCACVSCGRQRRKEWEREIKGERWMGVNVGLTSPPLLLLFQPGEENYFFSTFRITFSALWSSASFCVYLFWGFIWYCRYWMSKLMQRNNSHSHNNYPSHSN